MYHISFFHFVDIVSEYYWSDPPLWARDPFEEERLKTLDAQKLSKGTPRSTNAAARFLPFVSAYLPY